MPTTTRFRLRHGLKWTNALSVRLIRTVLALGLFTGDGVSAQEPVELGYVSSIAGTWLLGEDTVSAGRRIHRTDSVSAIFDSDIIPSMSVVLLSGQRVLLFCDVQEDCAGLLVPADSLRETSALEHASRIVKAVWSAFVDEPWDRVFTFSRSESEIREAVVAREGDLLNLTPLLRAHPPGRYRLTIQPVEEDDGADENLSLSTVLEWDPEQETHVAAPGIEPGLYRTEVSLATGLFAPTVLAWILVAELEEYEGLRAEFAKAVEITRSWRGDPSEGEVRVFLRAYLQHLAQFGLEREG